MLSPVWAVIYGLSLLLPAVVFGWNAWRQHRDSGRLRLTFEGGRTGARGGPRRVTVRIANVGTAPVTFTRLRGRERGTSRWRRGSLRTLDVAELLPRDDRWMEEVSLPLTLERENSIRAVARTLPWGLASLKAMFVEDQAGRLWRVSRHELARGRQLEAELLREKEESRRREEKKRLGGEVEKP